MLTHAGVVECRNIKRAPSTVGAKVFWMGDGGHGMVFAIKEGFEYK